MTRARSAVLLLVFLLAVPWPVAADEHKAPPAPIAGDYAPDRVIVSWRDQGKAQASAAAHGLKLGQQLGNGAGTEHAPGLVGTNGRPVAAVLDELRRDPNVAYAEPDYVIQLAPGEVEGVAVNDPATGKQYALDRMRVRDAWTISTGASNKIAVLDTGVQFSHPDLAGRLLPGWDFVNNDADASDDNTHGTWVAGIIAARANDGYGIAGISWSDKILPVKIMNANGSGYTSTLEAGLRWAADQGANVINMSIGGFPYSQSVQDAVNYAWSKGAVLVGAAGNNRREETHYPASYDHVVSVSATQEDDEFSNWSSYGPKVDVSAPGASIYTTNCDRGVSASCEYYGKYITVSGTSFATPDTSGVVALIRAKYPSYTAQQVVDRLVGTVDDLGYAGWDKYYGYGRVNAYRALGASVPAVKVPSGDGLEPNDTLGAARKIALGTVVSPTIYPAGDTDFFAVDVPRAGRLDVAVTAVVDTVRVWKSSLPVDPVVELLATDGTQIDFSDDPSSSASTEHVSATVSAPTRLIVHVTNWTPNGSTVPYTVRADYVDNVPPQVAGWSPADGSTDVNRYVAPVVTFDEPVTNVSDATVTLREASTGSSVPGTVTYDATQRTARLVVSRQLDAGATYTLEVGSGVRDTAGNAITAVSASFTTGEYGYFEIGGSAPLVFRAGTTTGYRFSSTGSITATRTYTLGNDSGAPASMSGTLPGQSGTWFYVTKGVWAGYWVRQSPGVYLSGQVQPAYPTADHAYVQPVSVSFQKGTQIGYRFDGSGRPTAARTYTLQANSSAPASALRSIANQYGRWYYITSGVWAGYWIAASDVAYSTDADSAASFPQSVSFAAGTYTGYQFSSAGAPTASKTFTLSRPSSATADAAGTPAGQTGTWLHIANGVWAGYWIRSSSGAYLAGSAPAATATSDASYDPPTTVSFARGTHVGYRFGSTGAPFAERTYTLGSSSSASASALRRLTNQYGRWLYITNGIWAGYWISESDDAFVR